MSHHDPNRRSREVGPRPRPRGRRWGRRLATAVALVLLGATVAVAVRSPVPVGHWRSAEGRLTYDAAYAAAFTALPTPAAVLDVRTDWGVVRLYRFAGAPTGRAPLVLLPGTASASPVWADNLPSLLRTGDVYAVDLLGEPGLSVQDRPMLSEADQAAWLDQALAGLPEPRFHVVGLSIGGWTAVNLAVHRPERLASVTLIDPAMVLDDIPVTTVVRSVAIAVPWFPRAWRDGFTSYTANGAPVEDVPVADMIEAGLQAYALALPTPTRKPVDVLQGIGVPTQVIVAGRSVMHDPARATAVASEAFGPSAVRFYEGASHAVNGEQPERIAADVAAWVSEHP